LKICGLNLTKDKDSNQNFAVIHNKTVERWIHEIEHNVSNNADLEDNTCHPALSYLDKLIIRYHAVKLEAQQRKEAKQEMQQRKHDKNRCPSVPQTNTSGGVSDPGHGRFQPQQSFLCPFSGRTGRNDGA
jgi:hypothetical protein